MQSAPDLTNTWQWLVETARSGRCHKLTPHPNKLPGSSGTSTSSIGFLLQ